MRVQVPPLVIKKKKMKNIINKKIFIETIGCQMNTLDSDLLKNNLKKKKYEIIDDYKISDIIIINTCSIRENSENKIINKLKGFIKHKKKNKNLIIGIIGCMAEKEFLLFNNYKEINFILGPNKIYETINIIENICNNKNKKINNNFSVKDNIYNNKIIKIKNKIINKKEENFIKLTKGCNNKCSFCIVPIVRGKEINRTPYEILEEIKKIDNKKTNEIILIGQTINHYIYKSFNKTIKFADLLYLIDKEIINIKRIKFLTSYPKNFDLNIISLIKESKKIVNFLHIPAQSGSNKILTLMKRNYEIEEYIELINNIKNIINDISIVGDIIVGFPNEKKKDLIKTIDLIKKIKYKKIFIFKYSKRKYTESENFYKDNIEEREKNNRLNLLLKIQNKISEKEKKKLINKTYEVIIVKEVNNQNLFLTKSKNDLSIFVKLSNDVKIGESIKIKIKQMINNKFIGNKI